MKNFILITICSISFIGCNHNPNKEARIQKLETEIKQNNDQINILETRIQVLEDSNNQLQARIITKDPKIEVSDTITNE